MKRIFRDGLAADILAVASQQPDAVTLQFDYSFDGNNFFPDPATRDVLEAAGTFFSTVFWMIRRASHSAVLKATSFSCDNKKSRFPDTTATYELAERGQIASTRSALLGSRTGEN